MFENLRTFVSSLLPATSEAGRAHKRITALTGATEELASHIGSKFGGYNRRLTELEARIAALEKDQK